MILKTQTVSKNTHAKCTVYGVSLQIGNILSPQAVFLIMPAYAYMHSSKEIVCKGMSEAQLTIHTSLEVSSCAPQWCTSSNSETRPLNLSYSYLTLSASYRAITCFMLYLPTAKLTFDFTVPSWKLWSNLHVTVLYCNYVFFLYIYMWNFTIKQ